MIQPLAQRLVDAALAAGATVTAAESCTGGMVAAAITDVPWSSAVFAFGFVTYADRAKTDLLGVAPATLAAHGAVSEAVAREMAEGALARAGATAAVAISGIAGPGGATALKPVGRVCFAIATATGTRSETRDYGAPGRAAVREAARDHALSLLLDALQARP
jgi:nicotinamide-nucleotide amidase